MKEQIRKLIRSWGADVCGFADVERFDNVSEECNPAEIFTDCKSVISFGIALPKGLFKVPPRLIYGYYNTFCQSEVDRIAFKAAKHLEESYHCVAVPMPCDSPYEYWDIEKMEGRGLLSMKRIAVAAGLGTIGKNALLLNKQFGNRLTLGTVLTDLELTSDPLAESLCMKKCRKCVVSCPVNAIENETVNQKLCRMHTYGKTKRGFDTVDCNRCRTVCPICYGENVSNDLKPSGVPGV
jgi:epoxyqueuosine reductase QueG